MKTLNAQGLETVCRLAKQTFAKKTDINSTIANTPLLNVKKSKTAYKVGDIVNDYSLPNGCVLECIQAGTTA